MYCPKCGLQASTDQKFCRSCGQDLNGVSQLVIGQSVIKTCKRWPMIWGIVMLLGGTAIGSVVKILSKEGIRVAGEFTPYLMALIVLMIFASFGLMLYSILPLINIRRETSQTQIAAARTTSIKVDALPEPMAVITEHTTELFEDERAKVPASARTTAPQSE